MTAIDPERRNQTEPCDRTTSDGPDDPTLGGLLESEVDELRSTFQGPAAMMWGLKLLGLPVDS